VSQTAEQVARLTDPETRSRAPADIFFGRDRGMVFFLGFLVLTIIVLPTIKLSQAGRLTLSFVFTLTLIFGAFATIRHRPVIYLVIGLTVSALGVDLFAEMAPAHGISSLDSALKVVCLSILVFMTLRRTLRPGPVTVYRVIGGIAGYLLIGGTWTFAYQLLEQQIPGAIRFEPGVVETVSQPNNLIYFSFITLTTVGYGDVHPVHPAARSLAVAEALVGQLYLAILIASLVGMAIQAPPVPPSDDCRDPLTK
jgi:hypothetical protein